MGLLYNQLIAFGLLNEMNDWKNHFINGTKGMPKTEESILNYVEQILQRSYEGNADRVKNNPLAPWLVMSIKEVGPENINTAKLNQYRTVIDYFKASGNISNLRAQRNPDGTFTVTPLEQASNYASEKLERLRQKEAQRASATNQEKSNEKNGERFDLPDDSVPEEVKTPEDEISLLQDEVKGRIERVWKSNDGTGRMWVKVIDPTWLTEGCNADYAEDRKWGVMCQATSQGSQFREGNYTNYQFIGPKKGSGFNGYSTIVGMSVLNSTGLIAEVKQEGNQQPGSQKTSGGWSDADVATIHFLSFAPIAKSNIKGFGNYQGQLEKNKVNIGTYGGSAFLEYLKTHKKVNLINQLVDARPDIFQLNEALLESLMGKDWFEDRTINIEDLAKTHPIDFIRKFESLLQKYGKQAIDLLNKINIEAIAEKNPELILEGLGSFVGNIPVERFNNLVKTINFDVYIIQHTEAFKMLVKNMANLPEYNNMFKSLIFEHSGSVIKAFGDKGIGIFKFLQFTAMPRLRAHQDAKMNPITGEYIAERDIVNNPNNPGQQRIVQKQKFVVPDNLKILSQKERRDFIVKHKDYILSLTPNLDDKAKEINYLRFLFSESNQQDIERTLGKEKDNFIDFYNSQFLKNDKKTVKIQGKEMQVQLKPGIFEFYAALNKKKPGYIKTVNINKVAAAQYRSYRRAPDDDKDKIISYYPVKLDEAKKYMQEIIKYYYSIRKDFSDSNKKDSSQIKYGNLNPDIQRQQKIEEERTKAQIILETIRDYFYTLKISGASEEDLMNEFNSQQFAPASLKISPEQAIFHQLETLKWLFEDDVAVQKIKQMKPYAESLGPQGVNAYKNVLESMYKDVYLVKPGDSVQYTGFDETTQNRTANNYGTINLKYGRKYRVLGVRSSTNYINGEVLIQDEGAASYEDNRGNVVPPEMPRERWLASYFFEIKTIKVLPDEIRNYSSETEEEEQNTIQEVRKVIRKRIEMIAERIEKKKRISYTGIVLDNKSKERLYEFLKDMKKFKKIIIPDDWTFSADHVTINMGPAIDPKLLGQRALLKVLTFAYDDNVIAVGVKTELDFDFEKENPHITIAFNEPGGARPVMSNQLKNWKPVPKAFVISGTIQEVAEEV